MTSQDSATAPTRYLLVEKVRELRGKYKSDKPWVSPIPCERCGGKIYGADHYQCRCCDPVERINALAEDCIERLGGTHWYVSSSGYAILFAAYIECIDIILESEQ